MGNCFTIPVTPIPGGKSRFLHRGPFHPSSVSYTYPDRRSALHVMIMPGRDCLCVVHAGILQPPRQRRPLSALVLLSSFRTREYRHARFDGSGGPLGPNKGHDNRDKSE